MVTSTSFQRQGRRYMTRIFWWAAAVVAVGIGIIVMRSLTKTNPFRTTLVITGNPIHVVSFDSQRNHVVIVDIPEDTVVGATHGYGAYRVGALLALDSIEKMDGRLFTESIADALGLPIAWYIHPQDGKADGEGSIDTLRSVFSWSTLPDALVGRMKHSVPIPSWIGFLLSVQRLKSDAVEHLDIRQAIIERTEADGSIVHLLDQSRLDFLLDATLVDTGLREESKTVAVINTTPTGGLGQKVARELGHIGIQVISVGSEELPITDCTVSGEASALLTKTARFILSYYHCKRIQEAEGDSQVTDLVVRMGTTYASRF